MMLTKEQNYYVGQCPHCELNILIYEGETNCCIFRHAIFKDTNQQINPHTPKEICETLIKEEKVYGCAKPFRLNLQELKIEICDYI